ncbi:MAG TPA: glycosyltransferase [Gemmatimonadaceae bacterium]|jgi:glycosyltransferase involved in cell wall biosynthesis
MASSPAVRVVRSAAPITILLPLKNYHPTYLDESLASIFRQTDSAWRLIIIVERDDEKRFRSLLSAALEDSRVRIIANTGRKLTGAFNSGMRVAESDFVAILLGDDMWAADAVEVLLREVGAHPEVDFFYSGRRVVDGAGRPIGSIHNPREAFSGDDFIWMSPVQHLLCWRREKALSFGGMDESLNSVGPDDYDFPWMMFEHGAVFRPVHECLYLYRDHQDSYRLTTHLPRSVHVRELRRILTKHGVSPSLIDERLSSAKRSFLRQCVYRNELHRRLSNLLGIEPRPGKRLEYK